MREYRFYDDEKATWGDGPWLAEPDKVQLVDEETGLDCLAVRNERHGNWCGYAGVPEGHPAFGQDYDNVEVDVHGGLTFSGFCEEGERAEQGICHVPEPGRPERVYWLGFDCNHVMDLAPGMAARERNDPEIAAINALFPDIEPLAETYRTLEYVLAECRELARQLAELETAEVTPPRAP